MDSVTQIVLGAACGEVVLGKKIGNKAMLWGAVGGTIPDLDVVVGNLLMMPIDALAFHRGFMHSMLFAFLFPLLIAWPVQKLYQTGLHDKRWYKGLFSGIWIGFLVVLLVLLNYSEIEAHGSFPFVKTLIGALLIFAVTILVIKRYFLKETKLEPPSYKEWYLLFFWSIFTHPLLDCCTTYGTQIFQPFSDYRVAFNNISVADPLYTLPFLSCLLLASYFSRGVQKRSRWNWIGIGISSIYLLFTFGNKLYIDSIFRKTMEKEGIEYTRFTTGPTILNNVYWKGTAENDTAYFHGGYSLLDADPHFKDFIVFKKDHHLLSKYNGDHTYETLKWFSNGYYTIQQKSDSTYQLSDLRFGLSTETYEDPSDFIFKFQILEKDGKLIALDDGDPPRGDKMKGVFSRLWERIKGKK